MSREGSLCRLGFVFLAATILLSAPQAAKAAVTPESTGNVGFPQDLNASTPAVLSSLNATRPFDLSVMMSPSIVSSGLTSVYDSEYLTAGAPSVGPEGYGSVSSVAQASSKVMTFMYELENNTTFQQAAAIHGTVADNFLFDQSIGFADGLESVTIGLVWTVGAGLETYETWSGNLSRGVLAGPSINTYASPGSGSFSVLPSWGGWGFYTSGGNTLSEIYSTTDLPSGLETPPQSPSNVPSGCYVDPVADVWVGLLEVQGGVAHEVMQGGYIVNNAVETGSYDYGMWIQDAGGSGGGPFWLVDQNNKIVSVGDGQISLGDTGDEQIVQTSQSGEGGTYAFSWIDFTIHHTYSGSLDSSSAFLPWVAVNVVEPYTDFANVPSEEECNPTGLGVYTTVVQQIDEQPNDLYWENGVLTQYNSGYSGSTSTDEVYTEYGLGNYVYFYMEQATDETSVGPVWTGGSSGYPETQWLTSSYDFNYANNCPCS